MNDPVTTVTKLARWAGLPDGPAAVEWAVAQSEFSTMRKMEFDDGLKLFDREYVAGRTTTTNNKTVLRQTNT